MNVEGKHYRTVWAEGASHERPTVAMIDQLRIPFEFAIHRTSNMAETCIAIKRMFVRGAGAIGTTGGFAAVQGLAGEANPEAAMITIKNQRPTAQNLAYAVDRVMNAAARSSANSVQAARIEAEAVADEDVASCRKIGEYGVSLIRNAVPRDPNRREIRIMTQCNAGWLAFTDWGSALASVYVAQEEDIKQEVIANKTGPRDQGHRITVWELTNQEVPCFPIDDTMVAYYMEHNEVDLVIVGSDRIAANGDFANKLGTQSVARNADFYGIPFYVAAPTSTIDSKSPNGAAIPIEKRSSDELFYKSGLTEDGKIETIRVVQEGIPDRQYPAFDVTPAGLVTKFITEQGIIEPHEVGKLVAA